MSDSAKPDILNELAAAAARPAPPPQGREPLPDLEAHNSTVRWMAHVGAPLLASLAAHGVLFIGLGFARWGVDGGNVEGVEYNATIQDAPPPEGFQWPAETPVESAAAPDEWPDALPDLSQMQTPSVPPASVAESPDSGGFGEIGDFGRSGVIGIGSGMGEGGGRGGAGGGFGERGPGATIFSFSAAGHRFVYVLDFSGSVIVAVDDLKRELKRSIQALTPNSQFNVVLFYETGAARQVVDLFAPALQPATAQNKTHFYDWIGKKAPNGSTAPLDALRRALAQQPDAVFFFSDGYFENDIVRSITTANTRQVPIHCLVFDEILINDRSGLPKMTDGAKRMQKLAEDNRGQVKIVTGRDIDQAAKGGR